MLDLSENAYILVYRILQFMFRILVVLRNFDKVERYTQRKNCTRVMSIVIRLFGQTCLRFCHRSDGRYGFEKNISCCTVSYTVLPMKSDLHFQPILY